MLENLRIAFFGSSLLSSYWNGAATYYRGIIRALHARGARTTFYEPAAFDRQLHADLDEPPWARVVVYQADNEKNVLRTVEQARGADLVVKASGVGVYDSLLEEAVLELRSPGTLVAFWDVDAPATLDRVHHDPRDAFRALIPRYDFVFTYGGGAPVVEAYKKLGAQFCTPIYNALDPETHFRVCHEPSFSCDLAFLGNRLPDREGRVDQFFFLPALLNPDAHFLLGGNGWNDKPLLANIRSLGHVYTADHNPINSSARAVLNISRSSMARYGFSPATRVFEAAGAAACLITDAWEGIELFLEPGREVLVAQDGEEVAAHLRFLRQNPAAAGKIGEAAFERILAEHTYFHRAGQLDHILEPAVSSVRGAAR